MSRRIAIAAAAFLILLLGVTYVLTLTRAAPCASGQIAGGDVGGPFTLIDENGRTVTDRDVITGPVLVYFGYTFCPDICPLDSARTAEAVDRLADRGLQVTPVFISVDPKRDTPAVLKDFTNYIHPNMVGLTGTDEQIKAAAKAYRTTYKVNAPDPGAEDYYLVDHMTVTYLMTPDGFLGFFRRDETPQEMADRVQCLLNTKGG